MESRELPVLRRNQTGKRMDGITRSCLRPGQGAHTTPGNRQRHQRRNAETLRPPGADFGRKAPLHPLSCEGGRIWKTAGCTGHIAPARARACNCDSGRHQKGRSRASSTAPAPRWQSATFTLQTGTCAAAERIGEVMSGPLPSKTFAPRPMTSALRQTRPRADKWSFSSR